MNWLRNKYLLYGLISLLVLIMLCDDSSSKIVFCKHCRTTRGIISEPDPNSTNNVDRGTIINVPVKCKPGLVPDKRNICRRVVYNN